MPTVLTHPVVAVALAPWFRNARERWTLVAIGAACAVVPDLDVIGLRLGIPYGDAFGHRGFSHSLVFAALLAAAVALALSWRWRLRALPVVWAYLFLCTASHGVLDAMTNGGLGIAFYWPFDDARYFLPWRPIAVSPLGASGFLAKGLVVLASELRWVVLPAAGVFVAGVLSRAWRKAEDRG